MKLSVFIQGLLKEGSVTIDDDISIPSGEDKAACLEILHAFYQEDKLEMPLTAPVFDEPAAAWAAVYFYSALQLTAIRELDETSVASLLKDYEGAVTAGAVYSVDLVFRHMPALLQLVKGLAPADILVERLQQTAAAWPFSFAGIALENIRNESVILADPSLRYAYTDRIIRERDEKKLNNKITRELVEAALGRHAATLWPGFSNELKIQ